MLEKSVLLKYRSLVREGFKYHVAGIPTYLQNFLPIFFAKMQRIFLAEIIFPVLGVSRPPPFTEKIAK